MKTNSNISQEQLEAIERYINGTMPDEELKAFKTRLENDSEFKTQVEDIRTLLTGIEAQSLKEQLDEFHKDIKKQPIKKGSAKVRYLQFRKIVAAAAIIIALGSFWFFNQNSNERLYSKYFTPDPGLPTTMSTSSNFDFYDAMVNYKQGDYKTAIKKWELLNANSPDNDTLSYFLGVAHLANKNEKEAIGFLEKSVKNDDFSLINDAYYYLGLSHLKDGNAELAKQYFKKSSVEKSQALVSELED
ncbi:MAG: tetratricopeptide repeat protein [Algicola sp.]|nr:tetratricopeptide repeat protein [Algicola sp.]